MTAFALLFFGLAACGQRGGARGGGFSGHSADSLHGGFAGSGRPGFASGRPGFASGRSGYAGGQRYLGQRGLAARYGASRYASAFRGYPGGVSAGRPTFYSRDRAIYGAGNSGADRRSFRGRDRSGYGYSPYLYSPYGLLGYNYLGDFLDSPDDFGYDNDAFAAQAVAPNPAEPPYQDESGAAMLPSYPPQVPQNTPTPAPAALAPEDPVTIVFKDGRPSEQIQNYALTRTTLYVPGRHIREIPVDQIDLAMTEKVNRDAGVDFQLPTAK